MALYNHYEELNKDVLLQEEDFIDDASDFLIDRGGYEPDELSTNEQVYDAFMQHFRFQNVNEVTALKDLNYAQDTDDEGRERMGRLMDTFDKMDSELGMTALGDYAAGVFTAPSTYAGMFSFGAGKAGALAAQQGIKLGIKEAIKRGGMRSALASAAIDAPVAAGTVAAQEATRVETGIKDEIDMSNVALAAGLSTVASGGIGLATGTKRALTENQAELLAEQTMTAYRAKVTAANKKAVKTLTDPKTSKTGKQFVKDAVESLEAELVEMAQKKKKVSRKLPLAETIPEELIKGEKIRLKNIKSKHKTLEQMEIENIASAASKLDDAIIPIVGKGGREEAFTSRLVRGLMAANEKEQEAFKSILKEHNLTFDQLAPVFAAEISRAGKVLQAAGVAQQKKSFDELFTMLNNYDNAMQRTGLDIVDNEGKAISMSGARDALEKAKKGQFDGAFTKSFNVVRHLDKARVGMMTVQASTTIRNTTNGYMRNYVYALDNLGASLFNITKGGFKGMVSATNKELREAAKADVRLAIGQLKTGVQSARLKDMVLGTESVDTATLFRFLDDAKFGNKKVMEQLFRGMGDIGNLTGSEGGLIALARGVNYFNTMSDNMFKRAIFSREVDKALVANPITAVDATGKTVTINSLNQAMKTGNFKLIDDSVFAKAMDEAFEFTYQTGKFKGREGGFNSFFSGVIGFGSEVGGSLVIPFPRYMVNQFRFFYEHMPLIGSVNLLGILNKPGGKAGKKGAVVLDAETFGKQVTGAALIGVFAALRANQGDETTGPYEYIDPTTGSIVDARASLGPFSGFALIADLLYRYAGKDTVVGKIPQWHDNKKVSTAVQWNSRELVQAFTGGQGRAGTGLQIVDGLVNIGLESSDEVAEQAVIERMARFAGTSFGTFLVPAGMVKDALASVDPEHRKLADNTDIDLFEYMLKQAAKPLPVAPDEEGRARLASPTRSGGVRRFNPFIKQITGFNPLQRRTAIERELDRLQFDYMEIAPRKIRLDAPMSNELREQMGDFVEDRLFNFMRSAEYKNQPTDKLKRIAMQDKISILKAEARARVLNIDRAETKEEQLRIARAKYNNLPTKQRTKLDELYRQKYPRGNGIVRDQAYWFMSD